MRYVGVCPYGVASRSGTRHPEVGRRSRHIDMDHLPGRQFDDEKGTKRTEEEIGHLQKITGPPPPTPLPHDGAGRFSRSVHGHEMARSCFIDLWIVRLLTLISSLSNSPRIRSAPQSRLFATISLSKLIVSGERLCFLAGTFDWRFQNQRKSSRVPRRSVSGWTRNSACFQVRTILAQRAPGGTGPSSGTQGV